VLVVLGVFVPAAFGGGAPAIAFTPSSVDFGGAGFADQTFTLKNTGGSATGALTVSLSGSSMYTKTSDTCSAVSLGPNKSCSVSVHYDANGYGTFTATLSAVSKKPLATATATMQGTHKSSEQQFCEAAGGSFTDVGPGLSFWTCGPLPAPDQVDQWANMDLFCELFDGGVFTWDSTTGIYTCSPRPAGA
jgi:hypothetical protein